MHIRKAARQITFLLLAVLSGLLISACSSQKASSRDRRKALEAYRKVLSSQSKMKDYTQIPYSQYQEDNQFGLVDINRDGIPEMLVTTDSCYHTVLLSYISGQAELVDSNLAGGTDTGGYRFYPWQSVYYTESIHGSHISSYCRFDGKESRLLCQRYDSDISPENSETTYSVEGKEVSADKYENYLSRLTKILKEEPVSMYEITEENIREYLR